MGILYVDRRGMELRDEGRHLAVYQDGERRTTVPLQMLDRLVIRGTVALSSALLTRLADQGIAVSLISGGQRRRTALLLGRPNGDTRRRIAQYRWHHDPDWQAQWSLELVRMKLRSERRLLLSAARRRADVRPKLTAAAEQIARSLASLHALEPRAAGAPRLRGIEGAAASAYFQAYTSLFPESLGFHGRNRRPPRDPVNSVLSLAYTLLHQEAIIAAHGAGLDPYVGFFHEPAHNRESLAADLIEPLRARVDEWTWRLFAERVLRADSFTLDDGACLLGKAGRQTFYVEYERFARPLRRLLRRYALVVARHLLEDATR